MLPSAMPPEPLLLEAGVVAVGHMCRTDSEGSHEWIDTYTLACRRNARLVAKCGAAAKAWARQLERLKGGGVAPVQEELVARASRPIERSLGRAGGGGSVAKGEVNFEAVESTLRALAEPDVCKRRSRQVWGRIRILLSAGSQRVSTHSRLGRLRAKGVATPLPRPVERGR